MTAVILRAYDSTSAKVHIQVGQAYDSVFLFNPLIKEMIRNFMSDSTHSINYPLDEHLYYWIKDTFKL